VPTHKTTIYIRLDEQTYEEFQRYCEDVALTTLIRLLIKRELKLRRLCEPWKLAGSVGSGKKIPIQLSDSEMAIRDHLPDQEIRESLRRLICIELSERWFNRALAWMPTQ